MTTHRRGVSRKKDTIVFTGLNIHGENGSESTEGPTSSPGNLIVGYNGLPEEGHVTKGSHNIIVNGSGVRIKE